MFELAQLRCFIMVATELNFRRAAQQLNMTQPPLSRQIHLLEYQLGVSLFTRTTRTVSLTAAGRAFLIEASSLLEHAERATQAARRIAAGDSGAVALSFVANAVYSLLPRALNELRERLPEIEVALQEMTSFEQQEALLARRIDIGIVRTPMTQPGISSVNLLQEPFVLAVPRQHPLARQALIEVKDLDAQPFILSSWQPFTELINGLIRAHHIQPRVVQKLSSTLTILSLVNAGMGLALVPYSASRLRQENLCFKPIALPSGIHSTLHIVCRDDDDNPACAAVRQALLDAASLEKSVLSELD
ncbi:LysR family transcriptional regulator [Pseudomonas sp. EL_65y_Pfl2_R95]|uniref:LysR family transcriptional regulator n=1 Tax=Pseudomonas sp. EL_65y_Pfl2_R95 TaxID=3088698 RepID=UPI0030D94C04